MSDPRAELDDLLKVMAHDLRNPLSAILTNLHFLAGALPQDNADAREALDDSLSLCDVVERIVGNLDLVAHKPRPISPCRVELAAVAQFILRKQQRPASLAAVRLEIVCDTPEEVSVMVDREMFVRAADNALSNSIEHAPRGTRVEVRIERDGADAAICMIDSGPAVPPELRSFAVTAEAQRRAGRKVGTRYGRGLGLLCADVAAVAAGARLEIGGDTSRSLLRLVAPAVP